MKTLMLYDAYWRRPVLQYPSKASFGRSSPPESQGGQARLAPEGDPNDGVAFGGLYAPTRILARGPLRVTGALDYTR